jgi:hypothetical protein
VHLETLITLLKHLGETGGVILLAIMLIAVPANAIDARMERRQQQRPSGTWPR